jgi:hypothetical protein
MNVKGLQRRGATARQKIGRCVSSAVQPNIGFQMQNKCISKSSARPSPPCTCLLIERDHKPAHEFLAEYGWHDGTEFLVRRLFKKWACPLVIIIRTPDGTLRSVSIGNIESLIGGIRHAFDFIAQLGYGHCKSRWIVNCTPPVAFIALNELQVDAYRFLEAV